MKKEVFRILAVIATIVFTFTSCEMDNEMNNEMDNEMNNDNIGNIKLLETISDDMGGYGMYEYDKQSRITKYSYFIPNKYGERTLVHTLTFTYMGDDLTKVISENEYYQQGYYKFEKSNNKINIHTSSGKNDKNAISSSLELDSDGLPVRYNENLSKDGNPSRIITYQFQNGNLVKTTVEGKSYNNEIVTSSTLFQYDEKSSPLYHCKTPKWFLFWYLREMCSLNNVTESTSSSSHNISDVASDGEDSTSTYEYVYDNNGFPTKRIEDGTKVTEYKYNK